jgi:hypothetical protein
MQLKSNMIAKIALSLSLISTAFAFYQWSDSQRQNRVNAAVELSKIYLTTGSLSHGYALLLDVEPTEAPGNYEKFLPARLYLDFLEYVAYLANQGRIDNSYISERIKCDIAHVHKTFIPKHPSWSRDTKEMAIYMKERRDADCPDSALQSN